MRERWLRPPPGKERRGEKRDRAGKMRRGRGVSFAGLGRFRVTVSSLVPVHLFTCGCVCDTVGVYRILCFSLTAAYFSFHLIPGFVAYPRVSSRRAVTDFLRACGGKYIFIFPLSLYSYPCLRCDKDERVARAPLLPVYVLYLPLPRKPFSRRLSAPFVVLQRRVLREPVLRCVKRRC